jgi:DNA-binding CsgD family transcriptional regulator
MQHPAVTPREIEILKMVAEGFNTREISSHLDISAHTVHTHRRNMQVKLGVKNVAHLIHTTWQRGWFSEYAVSV